MATINIQKSYPVSKKELWKWLTQDELLSQWCMTSKGFELRDGNNFVFETKANPFWGGVFKNHLTDFVMYESLSYDCLANKPMLTTQVTWTLSDQGGETLLSLEHSGFAWHQLLYKNMIEKGWHKMMHQHLSDKLKDTINGR